MLISRPSAPQSIFDSPTYQRLALGLAVVFTITGFAQIMSREIWMDEAWSLFLSDPLAGIPDLIFKRLAVDMHPPLFNLFLHYARMILPEGLVAARLVNLVVFVPVAVYFGWIWRRAPEQRGMLANFALLFCTGMFYTHYSAEARVYWSIVLASGCYALAGYRMIPAVIANNRYEVPDFLALMVSSALLLELHAYSAIFVSLHAGLNLLLLARHRRWRVASLYFLLMLGMGLVLVIWYVGETEFFSGMSLGGGWIAQLPLMKALRRVTGYMLFNALNPALLLLMLCALPALLRGQRTSQAATPSSLDGPERTYLLLLALAVAAFVLGIAVGNLFTPLIVDRYFSVLAGPMALITAALACRANQAQTSRGASANWFAAAVLLCALGAFAFQEYREPTYWNNGLYWGRSAEYARQAMAHCDQPVPHAASNRTHYVLNEEIALNWGAAEIGRRRGFRTIAARPGQTIRVSRDCPVALWLLLVQEGAENATVQGIFDELRLKLDGTKIDDLEIVPFGGQGVIQLKGR